jgi:hypothetical protein
MGKQLQVGLKGLLAGIRALDTGKETVLLLLLLLLQLASI